MSDAIPQFRAAMRAAGLEPPNLTEPGKLHRFAGIGKRRPAFAKNFQPGTNGNAVVCIGWPPAQPLARHVVVLPPDLRPAEIDWSLLQACAVFVAPAPGFRADPKPSCELLCELRLDVLRGPEVLLEQPQPLVEAVTGNDIVVGLINRFVLFDGERVIREYWRDSGDRPRVPQ